MLGYLLEKNPREVYSVQVVPNGFVLKIKESLCAYLLGRMQREELRLAFLRIPRTSNDGVTTFSITLPLITYPNLSHKKLDWPKLHQCAEDMRTLLWLFNINFDEDLEPSVYLLSDKPQLVAIEVSHDKDQPYHSCGIQVGFSPAARELLAVEYKTPTAIPKCEEIVFDFYSGLSESSRRGHVNLKRLYVSRGAGFNSVNVSVRNNGTPNFIVPGNCACLGANPDEFKNDGDIYSHNLDTPLQQIAMLAGVVSFWNTIIKPLYEAKQAN